jgi:hypothetical protein
MHELIFPLERSTVITQISFIALMHELIFPLERSTVITQINLEVNLNVVKGLVSNRSTGFSQ